MLLVRFAALTVGRCPETGEEHEAVREVLDEPAPSFRAWPERCACGYRFVPSDTWKLERRE